MLHQGVLNSRAHGPRQVLSGQSWRPSGSVPSLPTSHGRSKGFLPLASKGGVPTKDASRAGKKDLGAGLKAAWYGAELFGDFVGASKRDKDKAGQSGSAATATTEKKLSKEEVIAAIKEDYAADYFISGKGEMAAYDPQCLFADPFVSFRGVERFKKNVSNLGGLIRDVKLEITKFDQRDNEIEAFWKFSCILELPWRPLLAAAGSTIHVVDPEKGLVVEHIEQWKSDPGEVVKRLLRPAAKVPSSAWETFMLSLSAGDVKGCWWAVSSKAALLAAPVVGVSLLVHLVTGDGLPSYLGGSVLEVLASGLLAGALVTEVIKFAQGMQGGDTGTGGRF